MYWNEEKISSIQGQLNESSNHSISSILGWQRVNSTSVAVVTKLQCQKVVCLFVGSKSTRIQSLNFFDLVKQRAIVYTSCYGYQTTPRRREVGRRKLPTRPFTSPRDDVIFRPETTANACGIVPQCAHTRGRKATKCPNCIPSPPCRKTAKPTRVKPTQQGTC